MLGFGLGLRSQHYNDVLTGRPDVDWFELITENYLAPGGRPRAILRQVREHYPVVLHGLSFNIGTAEAPDFDYLKQLKTLVNEVQPAWVSDHLCWTGLHGRTSHDLLPIAYNQETLDQVASKVSQIQDYLGHHIVLENPSVYIQFRSASMSEAEFINTLVERTDCRILLDVNNLYVSCFNLGLDPYQWELYAAACKRFGATATLLERDDNIPPLQELIAELAQARAIQQQALDTQ